MPVVLHCPECGCPLLLEKQQLGVVVTCSSCDANFFANPADAAASGAVSPINPVASGEVKVQRRKPSGNRRLKILVVGVAVLLAIGGPAALVVLRPHLLGDSWHEVHSREGRFRVLMPTKPRRESKNLTTTDNLAVTVHSFIASDKGMEYGAAYSAFPPDSFFSYNKARDAVVKRLQGTLKKEIHDLRLHGCPGHEFHVDISNRGSAVVRMYVTRGRVIELFVAGTALDPSSAPVRRFFESLTLVDDLLYVTKIERFRAAAVDPSAKLVVTTGNGFIRLYRYPEFTPLAHCNIKGLGTQLALDSGRGLVYVAVCDSATRRRDLPYSKQNGLGLGDVHIFKVSSLEKHKGIDDLEPDMVIALQATLGSLALSPDGGWLYYLDLGTLAETSWASPPTNVKAGRIDTARREKDRVLALLDGTETLVLTQDGRGLYAGASPGGHVLKRELNSPAAIGKLQVIDLDRFAVRTTHTLDFDPYDMAVSNSGIAYLSGGSADWTQIVALHAGTGKIMARHEVAMGSFLKLTADQKRLYVADQELKPGHIQCMNVTAKGFEAGTKETEVLDQYELGTDFVLSPDSRFLLCRSGTVLKLLAAE